MNVVLLYLGAYLLGAIPFGVIIARLKGVNLLEVGSKNIGATNVWRTLGPGPGAAAMILDIAKGMVPAIIAQQMLHNQVHAFFVGIAAVVGHSLSPFIGFKGGKGVATTGGAMLGSTPLVGLLAFILWVSIIIITRYVSLASIIGIAAVPVFSFLLHDPAPIWITLIFIAAFVIYRHRANIERLRNGTEPKFRFGSKKKDEDESDGR